MKYNLTSETALADALKNHPNISDWSFWSIVQGSLFYNLTTLIVSLVTYLPIVFLMKRLIANNHTIKLMLTGFILTATTPIYYLILTDWKHNDYYLPNAERIAWILCFIISIGFYYLANRKMKMKNSG